VSTGGGSRPRVIALDGLRGVAIWLVMLVHFTRDQAQVALAIGVDVFFVLSGYLITSLVVAELRRDSFAVRTFMRRRLERIYPALLVLVVAFGLTGVGLFGSSPKRVLAEVFAALTFTYPLLLPTEIDGVLQLLPLWSLSVEVWFYFIWPPVLRRWTRRDRSDARLRRIAAWLVAGVVSVQVVRALTYAGPPTPHRPPRHWCGLRVDLDERWTSG
jgi:peptidoglycan/LPS O-acetylase OafA/YrhL